ncbi:hypothetical protein K474DRAFT_1655154 [Panus rudis PR-1116 ss-1]|nr:hypothetical protein K474DRAFT_1655154 [Panus rudis PR-1116 ss-1]
MPKPSKPPKSFPAYKDVPWISPDGNFVDLADIAQGGAQQGPVEWKYTPVSPMPVGDTQFESDIGPLRRSARQCFRDGLYEPAMGKYKQMVRFLVSKELQVPLDSHSGGGIRSEEYVNMPVARRQALLETLVNIAECAMRLERHEDALRWLDETLILLQNYTWFHECKFDWAEIHLPIGPVYLQRVKAYYYASKVFLELGNTSAAAHRRWQGIKLVRDPPRGIDLSCLFTFNPPDLNVPLADLRHPDPNIGQKLELRSKSLQLMGSWSKINIPKEKNITARSEFASFVWNGRFYVAGGEKALEGPFYRDIKYIILSDLEAGWHTHLPSYPIRKAMSGHMSNWSMCVWNNKAYIYNGSPVVDYFDLVGERWSSIRTTYHKDLHGPKGPFPGEDLVDYSMEIFDGKMYVFGGTYTDCEVGCNTLICLDLATHVWRRLSGYPGPKLTPEWTCPGPRRHVAMWLDKRVEGAERLYLLFGEADRRTASNAGQTYGAMFGYMYDDFWSWDIHGETWRRERLEGNPPCPRSEMGCTFNEKLGVAVIFGGYSSTLPAHFPELDKHCAFSYFGDTFIYVPPDPTNPDSRPKFQQVITRGFPTYRAQAHMFTDPSNGKMYLFAGYTNSQLIADKKNIMSRSFADIWQLKLDMPGGYFEGVDLEEEARNARVGPWQKCYNCGNVGSWKKCGGSCEGKVFFCDPQCLRERWKEHKERHGCRKK